MAGHSWLGPILDKIFIDLADNVARIWAAFCHVKDQRSTMSLKQLSGTGFAVLRVEALRDVLQLLGNYFLQLCIVHSLRLGREGSIEPLDSRKRCKLCYCMLTKEPATYGGTVLSSLNRWIDAREVGLIAIMPSFVFECCGRPGKNLGKKWLAHHACDQWTSCGAQKILKLVHGVSN